MPLGSFTSKTKTLSPLRSRSAAHVSSTSRFTEKQNTGPAQLKTLGLTKDTPLPLPVVAVNDTCKSPRKLTYSQINPANKYLPSRMPSGLGLRLKVSPARMAPNIVCHLAEP